MSFYELIQHLLDDTLGTSLGAFLPELILCATVVVLLLTSMFTLGRKIHPFYIMATGLAAALYFAAPWHYLIDPSAMKAPTPLFTGMLVFDPFAVYMRGLLLFFVLLYATFVQTSGMPVRSESTEFYVLILGALLGMCLMVSANHMLIVFLGFEMASVPSYALAGFVRGNRRGSEAALKFAIFGAAAAGVMLYGISLLVGMLGSAHLPTMGIRLAEILQTDPGTGPTTILMLAGLMLAVGLAFKLSAVPFHFWAPDVFEGTTAEVAGFLSIASKAAALGLVVRLAVGFSAVSATADVPSPVEQRVEITMVSNTSISTETPVSMVSEPEATPKRSAAVALGSARRFIVGLITLIAAITCTFGNLAAYGQTNMKRLLAYSTIAHAGYMLMPIAAAVHLIGTDPGGARDAIAALGFYLGIYLFMNLGAFAFCAFYRNETGSEEIADYAGLIRRSPGLVICVCVILFSLVGLPPLAGFAAKFAIFAALFNAGLLTLLAIGGVNTVLSLFYYLRVAKVMTLSPEPTDREAPEIPLSSVPGAYCFLIAIPLVVLGLWWNGLFEWADSATWLLF